MNAIYQKPKNWEKFSRSQHLLMIGSEIMRAKVWQNKDKEKFLAAIERAFVLIDAALEEARWKNYIYMLMWLRQELAKYYLGQEGDIEILYKAL